VTTVEGLVIRIRLQLHLREANRTPILYFGPPTPLQSRVNRKSEAKPINQAHEPLRNRIEARGGGGGEGEEEFESSEEEEGAHSGRRPWPSGPSVRSSPGGSRHARRRRRSPGFSIQAAAAATGRRVFYSGALAGLVAVLHLDKNTEDSDSGMMNLESPRMGFLFLVT
jgi:hypothetical protein